MRPIKYRVGSELLVGFVMIEERFEAELERRLELKYLYCSSMFLSRSERYQYRDIEGRKAQEKPLTQIGTRGSGPSLVETAKRRSESCC